jgi:glycosyltransferase involved in cell wall biosynthesis
MKKIGIDIRSAGGEKAGKGWFTFNIVRELLALDKKNHYILYTQGGIAGFEEFKNVEMRIVEAKGFFWHREVAKDVVKEGLDVFYAPTSYIIPALLPKPTKPNAPKTILTIHDLVAFLFTSNNRKAQFIERFFLKRALKKASGITCVSENTKKDLKGSFPELTAKTDPTITPCAPAQDYAPIEKTEKNLANLQEFINKTHLPTKFFLAVGTIEPRKNYQTLIQAFALAHKQNQNLHLVIVGGKGWGGEKEAIEQMIQDNYLQKYVHELGYLTTKTINRLYNLAQALVFPSHYEGFGMPLIEAMAANCPVIASNTSSIPEVVGDAAIQCDPNEPTQFAEAMLKIAASSQASSQATPPANSNLRQDLINKGRIQSKRFTWEKSADKLLETIYNVTT